MTEVSVSRFGYNVTTSMQSLEMNQPFSKKQIRSFFLFYGGVILLVVFFYIMTSLFYTPASHERKHFRTEPNATRQPLPPVEDSPAEEKERPFRLLPAR
jgi:hypothetical protein